MKTFNPQMSLNPSGQQKQSSALLEENSFPFHFTIKGEMDIISLMISEARVTLICRSMANRPWNS